MVLDQLKLKMQPTSYAMLFPSQFYDLFFTLGFALLILLLFLICCAFYSLSFEYVQDKIVGFLKGGA